MNRPDSTSKTMLKNAELKLQVADFRKNCDCGITELRLRHNMSVKSCGIAITEVLPSSCGIVIADSKKSCACPPLDKGQWTVYSEHFLGHGQRRGYGQEHRHKHGHGHELQACT